MAQTIKKFKTPTTDLPPVSSVTEGYSLRYRIISSDKNRTSHWSPVYLILPDYTFVPETIDVSKQGDVANIVWDAVTVNKIYQGTTSFIGKAAEYDIWLRWDRNDGGDWLYKERLQTTSLSLPIPLTYTVGGVVQGSAPNKLSVEIYLKGFPVERADGAVGTPFLKVYRQLNVTV
jgi:hypothetical protein